MINAVAFVSGGRGRGGRGRRQREGKELQQCFFFSRSHRTCKSTCKTLSSRLRLSSVLPCSPLSSLSLHTPLSPTRTLAVFARVSSLALRPGALITGPLISAETFPLQLPRLGLSPFTCFPRPSALSHFHLAAPSLSRSVVTTRSCGQLGGGRIDLASRWVSPTEPYGARLMR